MADRPIPLFKERTPEEMTAGLVDLLIVETLDDGLYQGAPLPGGKGRVFGGQVVAQALQAARQTVDLGPAHSLHCYFMRPGEEGLPIIYQVTRDHDGRSFATRRVIASQRGVPILSMLLSFQAEEAGLEHQDTMPDVPPPEELISETDYWKARVDKLPDWAMRHLLRPRPVEFRHVQPRSPFGGNPRPPRHASWFRTVAPLPDDPAMHQAVLAYASDMTLLGTASLPHGISFMTSGLQSASLDHALWFHQPVPADDWILYVTDSPWAGGARGLNRGQFYTRDGKLVASVAQEGLMRMRKKEPRKTL
ncbi:MULTISPECIES: acyl-CoA thioesterase [unclassified Brevundimonas]|uniref:acyl-CoA thioesterase n=1 Tax=unclassified Brevundimonas TaxID=2622653 RepID=UPI0025BF30CA|nr:MULTISPECIES: acyl-CoA thioesterase II [unclassified Brevundimonas]